MGPVQTREQVGRDSSVAAHDFPGQRNGGVMPNDCLKCDQAIFTSIRSPTGEGYRVVAASRGLRPDDKQVITRFSPSHDALCHDGSAVDNGVVGVSFYPVSRERLCVGVSSFAGAEHTGRGGQRVYTLCVIFDAADFSRTNFNPYVVVRALWASGSAQPELRPQPVLPDLELPIYARFHHPDAADHAGHAWHLLSQAWRKYALHHLLQGDNLVINLPHGWVEAAEWLLMGVPGPMRAGVSFSAGLKYSTSRNHRLTLSHEDARTTRSRLMGRATEFLDPASSADPQPVRGDWLEFVDRHWNAGDIDKLSLRTSRALANVSCSGRDWLARTYGLIDEADKVPTPDLLDNVGDFLPMALGGQAPGPVERDLASELCEQSRQTLASRFSQMGWPELQAQWPALCDRWRMSDQFCAFLQPLVEKVLLAASRVHPAAAAEAALQLAPISGCIEVQRKQTLLVNRMLAALCDWADAANDEALRQLPGNAKSFTALVARWSQFASRYPTIERLSTRLNAISAST